MLKGYFLCTYSFIELTINPSFVQQTSNKLLLYKAHLICVHIVKQGKKNRGMYLEVGSMKLMIIKKILWVSSVCPSSSTLYHSHLALGFRRLIYLWWIPSLHLDLANGEAPEGMENMRWGVYFFPILLSSCLHLAISLYWRPLCLYVYSHRQNSSWFLANSPFLCFFRNRNRN